MIKNEFIEEINKFFNSETLLLECKKNWSENLLPVRIKIVNNLLNNLKTEEQSETVGGVFTLTSGQELPAPAKF